MTEEEKEQIPRRAHAPMSFRFRPDTKDIIDDLTAWTGGGQREVLEAALRAYHRELAASRLASGAPVTGPDRRKNLDQLAAPAGPKSKPKPKPKGKP